MSNLSDRVLLVLSAAAAFFYLEALWEMTWLTFTGGPQMIFFSVAHGALGDVFTLVWALSLLAYLGLLLFVSIQLLLLLARKNCLAKRRPILVGTIGLLAVTHFLGLVTYDIWSD